MPCPHGHYPHWKTQLFSLNLENWNHISCLTLLFKFELTLVRFTLLLLKPEPIPEDLS